MEQASLPIINQHLKTSLKADKDSLLLGHKSHVMKLYLLGPCLLTLATSCLTTRALSVVISQQTELVATVSVRV